MIEEKSKNQEQRDKGDYFHGFTALESINEKIQEEAFSHDEEEDQQNDGNSENILSSIDGSKSS